MCGFLGKVYFNEAVRTSNADFLELLAKVEGLSKFLEIPLCRGPDNSSILHQDDFQLGFNRLVISKNFLFLSYE